jgi:hypothetical protein
MADNEHNEHASLKTISTSIADFLASPKEFLSKLLEENLVRLEIALASRQILVMTKDIFDLLIKLEIRKERLIFEQKYQELKARFIKQIKDDVNFDMLTKAQQTLIQLERKFQLQKNSFFGEMAYIANKPRNATTTIKSDSAILLTFRVKSEVNSNQSEAFMKLFQNITNMLVVKVEEMNHKLYPSN